MWDDTVEPEDLRALHRADELDPAPDVLVVGGGVVGLAVAAMCVRAGLGRVQVVERQDRLCSWASGRAAGGLSPGAHVEEGAGLQGLAQRSLELHRELDADWGYGLETVDDLVCGPGAGWEDAARATGGEYVAEPWRLVPELAPDVAGGVRFPDQAKVHPLRLAAALARNAGRVTCGVSVDSPREAGAVVWATGVVDGAPRQEWVKGHLIATEPAPFRLGCDLATGRTLVIQRPDGRLIAGGTLDVGDDEPVVRDDVVAHVRRDLAELLPASADLEVTHAWCCFRPATPDRLPVIDRIGEREWITCGHFRTGLLMAPATGEAIAEWISTGERPERVKGFADRG